MWNIIVFSRRSIWVLLELIRRWTQHFSKIDQEKCKIEQICIWNPMTYINMEFLSLSRRHSSSRNVPQWWWAGRNVCCSQAKHEGKEEWCVKNTSTPDSAAPPPPQKKFQNFLSFVKSWEIKPCKVCHSSGNTIALHPPN